VADCCENNNEADRFPDRRGFFLSSIAIMKFLRKTGFYLIFKDIFTYAGLIRTSGPASQ
jgi:hypothetical protein